MSQADITLTGLYLRRTPELSIHGLSDYELLN